VLVLPFVNEQAEKPTSALLRRTHVWIRGKRFRRVLKKVIQPASCPSAQASDVTKQEELLHARGRLAQTLTPSVHPLAAIPSAKSAKPNIMAD
jgi:hypothetical protein